MTVQHPGSEADPSPGVADGLPLSGVVVVDTSRMLPGAILARLLLDLGARLMKVEGPEGDPMRAIPPIVAGAGAGFAAMYAGAEFCRVDLRAADGAAALRRLAAGADVLIESFRPGTMERWGIGHDDLAAANPGLITCALSGFASGGAMRDQVAHDLNVAALSGLLSTLPCEGVPGVQIADVATGLLASTAVLAALLSRARTGRGMRLEQPLASGALPFLAWARADRAAGDGAARAALIEGGIPAYRVYRCADGRSLAVGALEPKFWAAFVGAIGLPELAPDGVDAGRRGARAAEAVSARLAEHPASHWLALPDVRALPVSPVRTVAEAVEAGFPDPDRWLPSFPPPIS